MDVRVMALGDLTCRVLAPRGETTPPRRAIVLCHGYGAPGTDLVGLAPELVAHAPDLADGTRWVFPEAPLSLDALGAFGGRAWWHLDWERIQALQLAGRIRDLSEEEPDGLASARRKLRAALDALLRHTDLGWHQLVLGGFSQGAMLSIDLTLRLDEPPAGLVALSGNLLNGPAWRKLAPKRRGLPVFQSHGRHDDVLPFAGAEAARDVLSGAGLDVEFHPFDGPHTITPDVVESLARFLSNVAV